MTGPGRAGAWLLLAAVVACGEEPVSPEAPEEPRRLAAFELSGRILGPASSDDDADMEFTLRETRGVSADIDFVRLTCSSGGAREWGASSFVAERGSNRIEGRSTLVFVRHYTCPASGRPARIAVELTDASGNRVRVEAAPFHPDWPGA